MPIITLREILADAHRQKYGVAMYDVHNLEMTNAVVEAAEEERSPIILALAEAHVSTPRMLEDIANIMVFAARRTKIPVCVHFDHGVSFDNCLRAMHMGFSSVMYDGSVLPYEENISNTVQVVKLAALFGASVEAELGHVGGAEGGGDDGHAVVYTDPNQAVDYVSKTGVDALAVSVGTAHGAYRETPKLDLMRLRAIRAKVSVPLVLHGGSGLSDLDFRNCIQAGISKINIYTEIVKIAMDRISCEVAAPYSDMCRKQGTSSPLTREELIAKATAAVSVMLSGDKIKYPDLMRFSTEGMKEAIKEKLRLFGSSGKAR